MSAATSRITGRELWDRARAEMGSQGALEYYERILVPWLREIQVALPKGVYQMGPYRPSGGGVEYLPAVPAVYWAPDGTQIGLIRIKSGKEARLEGLPEPPLSLHRMAQRGVAAP